MSLSLVRNTKASRGARVSATPAEASRLLRELREHSQLFSPRKRPSHLRLKFPGSCRPTVRSQSGSTLPYLEEKETYSDLGAKPSLMSSKRKVLVKEKLPAAKSDNEQKNNEESPSQPKPAPPRPQKSQQGSSSARSGYEHEKEAPSLKKLKTVPSTSLKQVEVEKLGHAGEESKKLAFQKIWGDDDEITLLQGIIDYCEKGMDPFTNVSAFYHDVKGSLRDDFTESQLANKVRVFKKKYRNNKGKGKVGEDRVFSNSHEGKVFELSKMIWGVEMRGNATSGREEIGVTIENKKTDGAGMFVAPPGSKSEASKSNDSQELLDDISHMCRIGLDEGTLNQGLALLEPSKRAELNERWSKLFCAEMQIVAERCAVIEDQLKLILEAYYHSTEK